MHMGVQMHDGYICVYGSGNARLDASCDAQALACQAKHGRGATRRPHTLPMTLLPCLSSYSASVPSAYVTCKYADMADDPSRRPAALPSALRARRSAYCRCRHERGKGMAEREDGEGKGGAADEEEDWEAAADKDEDDWETSVADFKALTVKADEEEDEWEVTGSAEPTSKSSNRRADAYSGGAARAGVCRRVQQAVL